MKTLCRAEVMLFSHLISTKLNIDLIRWKQVLTVLMTVTVLITPFRKRYFIAARPSFAVKSPLFCAIVTSDLQQTLNNHFTPWP
jgi:hypothetical protein